MLALVHVYSPLPGSGTRVPGTASAPAKRGAVHEPCAPHCSDIDGAHKPSSPPLLSHFIMHTAFRLHQPHAPAPSRYYHPTTQKYRNCRSTPARGSSSLRASNLLRLFMHARLQLLDPRTDLFWSAVLVRTVRLGQKRKGTRSHLANLVPLAASIKKIKGCRGDVVTAPPWRHGH